MERHGKAWALILKAGGEEFEHRNQGQLKDKWRNLEKTVCKHRQPRGEPLDHHLKNRILQLHHLLIE